MEEVVTLKVHIQNLTTILVSELTDKKDIARELRDDINKLKEYVKFFSSCNLGRMV